MRSRKRSEPFLYAVMTPETKGVPEGKMHCYALRLEVFELDEEDFDTIEFTTLAGIPQEFQSEMSVLQDCMNDSEPESTPDPDSDATEGERIEKQRVSIQNMIDKYLAEIEGSEIVAGVVAASMLTVIHKMGNQFNASRLVKAALNEGARRQLKIGP